MVPSIIKDIGKVEVKFREPLYDKHVVEFKNVVIGKPTIRELDGTVRYVTPQECVARRTTYHATIMVDVYNEVYEQKLTSECEELKEDVKKIKSGITEFNKIIWSANTFTSNSKSYTGILVFEPNYKLETNKVFNPFSTNEQFKSNIFTCRNLY